MADQEKIINVRVMRGVDLNANARLVDPGTYRSTTNLYARLQGILELRPGSKLISAYVTKHPVPTDFPNLSISPALVASTPMEPAIVTGQKRQIGLSPVGKVDPVPLVLGGMRGQYDASIGNSFIKQKIPEMNVVPVDIDARPNLFTSGANRVAALDKIALPYAGLEFWIGAMNNHLNDFLFYLDTTTSKLVPIISDGAIGVIHCHEGQWQLQPAINSSGNNNTDDSALGILAVNGVDQPLFIKNNYTNGALVSGVPPFQVTVPTIVYSGDTNHKLTGPTCVTQYGNQMIWGGGVMNQLSTGDCINLRHCLVFSNPAVIYTASSFTDLAGDSTVSGAYTLQIGDTPEEIVTAVSGSPALTDGFGAQGQLIAWTGYKTQVYNGPIPSSGNPAPPGFGLAAVGTVGTWSPKSIVRTEFGTVYLGSDGLVYMVALNNRIAIIGRALEPILGGRSRTFYKNICAYYKKGFYHIFFPQNLIDGVNKLEYVADLRGFNTGDRRDSGCEWFGPFTGRYVSCVKVGRGVNDPFVIYAGLGHAPAIIELERADTFSDPNMMALNGTKIVYEWGFETGDLDLGDAHLDKKMNAFSIGIATQHAVSVKGTVAAMSDIAGVGKGFSKTKTVLPNSTTLGSNFTLGNQASMSSLNNFALPTWQPSEVIRGRAFTISVTATPTVESFVRISDLEFRVVPFERRATDL